MVLAGTWVMTGYSRHILERGSVRLAFGLSVGWKRKGGAETTFSVPPWAGAGASKVWLVGHIQSGTRICTAHELKVVFTF